VDFVKRFSYKIRGRIGEILREGRLARKGATGIVKITKRGNRKMVKMLKIKGESRNVLDNP